MMIEWVHALDLRMLDAVYAERSLAGVDFNIWVSELGRPYTIGALTTAAGLFFYLKKEFVLLSGLLLAVLTAAFVVILLKDATAIARPAIYAAYPEIGYAFPSGHVAGSVAFYGFCVFLAWRYIQNRFLRWALTLAAVFLVALIAYSRVYLGVHYPSDIVGGAFCGALSLLLGILAVKRNEI